MTFGAAMMGRATSSARLAAFVLLAAVVAQVALGALTVVNHVPIAFAALHQANGALLLGAAVALVHALRRA